LRAGQFFASDRADVGLFLSLLLALVEDELLLPGMDHFRMHAVHTCQLHSNKERGQVNIAISDDPASVTYSLTHAFPG